MNTIEYFIHPDTAEYWLLKDRKRKAHEIDEILEEIEDGDYEVYETDEGYEVQTKKGYEFLIKEG
jgi:chromosome segregation and condensation protein ScpB